jgi:hypothetical protein
MGDGKLLEEVIFRNCQFLQVGHTETVSRITRREKPTNNLNVKGPRGLGNVKLLI